MKWNYEELLMLFWRVNSNDFCSNVNILITLLKRRKEDCFGWRICVTFAVLIFLNEKIALKNAVERPSQQRVWRYAGCLMIRHPMSASDDSEQASQASASKQVLWDLSPMLYQWPSFGIVIVNLFIVLVSKIQKHETKLNWWNELKVFGFVLKPGIWRG